MRAQFLHPLPNQSEYQLKGDEAHHLINVVRVELGEELLLLDGKGLKVHVRVKSLLKRELILETIKTENLDAPYKLDLALGIPKKEALEVSLKAAVELGIRRIYLIRAQYSQIKVPEAERLHSLLINALEQSNNAFLPEIITATWEQVPFADYAGIYLMDSQNGQAKKQTHPEVAASRLLIVGPEGGFSEQETTYFQSIANLQVLRLPSPILRTQTAVAAGAGVLLGSLLD